MSDILSPEAYRDAINHPKPNREHDKHCPAVKTKAGCPWNRKTIFPEDQ